MSQREILFKAKRTDNGEWVEGFPYYGDYSGAFILQNKPVKRRNARTGEITLGDEVFPIEVDGRTYCQYTGLTDKNGKKIFEGDILKYKDDYTKETKCEVQFHRFGFMAVWPNDWDAESLDNGFHVYSEVIGNIHDN